MLSISDIGILEETEEYPEAIDALEELLQSDPENLEIVARLGFNLWYAAAEAERMAKKLPVESYWNRFMGLYQKYETTGIANGEFCWAFGLGLELFWYHCPGANETMGPKLLAQAGILDPFWKRLNEHKVEQEELTVRLKGKGIFAKYYGIVYHGDSPDLKK